MNPVAHDGPQQKREQEHSGQALENHQEGCPEGDTLARLQQREDGRNEQGHRHGGQEHEGGHLRQVTAQLCRHHGRGGGTRCNHADENGLKEES